ncbi:porin family protein [Rhodomicrobium sp. Az07]|uniref:outer membrane protein n=1 Tax=Rhodomicrobium sp. Az07 TaxID=2839034 RepID=UPI001BE87C5B|nr:outer membrane protein [Rhodomicrobium sp. Az07]MBT3070591.1 porin family protein [Rhodomicrobium sp. Az07]
MKKIILGVASVVALSSSAFAADLYKGGSLKDAPVYEAPATWTGFYLGVHGGYGFGDLDGRVYYNPGTPVYDIADKQKTQFDGGFGGGQIGYNKQISSIVLGIEADISGSAIEGKDTFTTKSYWGNGAGTYSKTFDATVDYFGTVRGRIGYAFGGVLPYVTGGFAWGHVELDNTVFGNGEGAVTDKGNADATLTGWTAGGGLEAALTGNWSLKTEYLYVDLGDEDFHVIGKKTNGNVFDTDHYKGDVTFHTVKLGLNYKFGGNVYEPLK